MKKFIKFIIVPALIATASTTFACDACGGLKKIEKADEKKVETEVKPVKKTDQKAELETEKKEVGKKAKEDLGKKFFIDLKITNGHLGKVILGCHEKGTDKLDRKLDDMAPPPGMQTGYTALVSPNARHYLYRDVRGFSDEIIWHFYAKLNNKKYIELKWNKNQFPAEYNFFIGDQELDMRKINSHRITSESVCIIIAEKKKIEKRAIPGETSKPAEK